MSIANFPKIKFEKNNWQSQIFQKKNICKKTTSLGEKKNFLKKLLTIEINFQKTHREVMIIIRRKQVTIGRFHKKHDFNNFHRKPVMRIFGKKSFWEK